MTPEIDIDHIIRDKAPDLYRMLPGFLKRYIKRTIHQDQINYCLRNFGHLEAIEFIRATLRYMEIDYRVHGMETLDPQKRYIFASNHPLGGLDGLILADAVEKHFGSVKLVVNDLLMNLTPIRSLFVPVNKHGKQSAEYVRGLNRGYDSDEQIIYFPAGLCSRKIHGKIQDPPWRKNFMVKAREHGRDIVPVYVDAVNSRFFYNFARLRKALGVKVNIEMFYLPDEMFSQRGKKMDIYVGTPIEHRRLCDNRPLPELVAEIRKAVYALKK